MASSSTDAQAPEAELLTKTFEKMDSLYVRKIYLYNMHKKAAHVAENTLSWTSKAAPVITAERHEEAKKKHLEALDRFWVSKDPAGKILIDRAGKLRDEQCEKAKNAKQEDAKGSEGEQ